MGTLGHISAKFRSKKTSYANFTSHKLNFSIFACSRECSVSRSRRVLNTHGRGGGGLEFKNIDNTPTNSFHSFPLGRSRTSTRAQRDLRADVIILLCRNTPDMRCASATLGARLPRHRVVFLDLSWLLHNHWHVSDHVPAVVVSPLRHSSRRRHHHPCDRGRTGGQFRVICSFAHIFSVLAPNRPLFVANFPFWRVEDAPRRSYAWRHYAMSYSSRRQALKNCHARPLRQVLSGWFPKNFRPAMQKFPWKIANYPPPSKPLKVLLFDAPKLLQRSKYDSRQDISLLPVRNFSNWNQYKNF